MENWKTRSKQTVFSMGKWLSVENHAVELPDGRVIDDWAWVITPDFVNVVAVTQNGQVVMFRQVKYALEGESLAPVGGYCEPGEDPLDAAKRELLEETGYAAEHWTHLGTFRVDPNRGVATGSLFLARGAQRVAERNADDLEEQHLVLMSVDAVEAALMDGQVKSLAWVTVLALALLEIKRTG